MTFVDSAKIFVEAGRGGSGCVSFRREKKVPKGGPDGGDGGDGGNIIIRTNAHLRTLLDYQRRRKYRADRGQHGMGSNRTGRSGNDVIIEVPIGTVIHDDESNETLADMIEEQQEFVVARGGRGGRGNAAFATSTHQAPREWEQGTLGESRWINLELKLLADVGLVGLPNAGKSTLLSRISAARPKIADYPFTTLSPNLGVVSYSEFNSFVVADIPGLIEGAHEGRGLGMQFLRHIERTRVLVLLIEATDENPAETYRLLMAELAGYDKSMLAKQRLIVMTKIDLLPAEDRPKLVSPDPDFPIARISSATGEGLTELVDLMWQAIDKLPS